jgi:hypothetical protein
MDLVIRKRKGFAKIALETGTDLVPIIGFGENEIYYRPDHPILDKIHKFFRKHFKISAPLFFGKFLLFPLPSKLVTVGKFYLKKWENLFELKRFNHPPRNKLANCM